MKFKEISLTAQRPLNADDATLENMSRVICSLFSAYLQKKLMPVDFWKISINFNNLNYTEKKIIGGVLIVNKKFPVSEFLKWELNKRQNYMLEFISNTAREIFCDMGVDKSIITEAAEYVMEKKYINIFSAKKYKSPFDGKIAHIECVQTMDDAKIYIIIKHKGEDVKRSLVTMTSPEEFIFQKYFGKIEWLDESNAQLIIDGDAPFLLTLD